MQRTEVTAKKKNSQSPLTVDALVSEFLTESPDAQRLLHEARLAADLAEAVYTLRSEAGLTQRELAARVGTTASVISRLESADYQGHSLGMLNRIAAAVGKAVELHFVDLPRSA